MVPFGSRSWKGSCCSNSGAICNHSDTAIETTLMLKGLFKLPLCALPKEQQERIEVEKAAAYAVWKEHNGHLASAETEANPHQGELGRYFLEQVGKYKRG